ncbi:MAG: sulfatase [Isosphaeraceae bacterium]
MERRSRTLGSLDVLLLSAWCGLAAGELEVAARFLYRALSPTNQLFNMTRHFVWLVPLVELTFFLAIGLVLTLATRLWPGRGGWLSRRLLCALTLLPMLLVAGRRIYSEAWLICTLGVAACVVPPLERHGARTRRWLAGSFPVLLALVLVQGAAIKGGDRFRRWRESSRPPPPAGSPNVLLIVLDTVRADHLSLHGYYRPTSKTLERLARQGLRFDQARAAAPWTLASHATFFTGRLPSELNVKWMHPLSDRFHTLAEYLGARGYATAGFVGNTFYCAYDSGLNRGFTHYEDYALGTFDALRTVHLINLALKALPQIVRTLGQYLPVGSSLLSREVLAQQLTFGDRKDAGVVTREFLDWLAGRPAPGRPFFAFLNLADAHAPYVLPPGAPYRFGLAPRTELDFLFLLTGWFEVDRQHLSALGKTLARDSYDNCLAYLDERLDDLFEELKRRGALDNTLVIVTADHGEGLGEHGLFDHGESLYRTEIGVPLLIVLPGGGRSTGVVNHPVSLRDLPATIADLATPGIKPPFPGRSLRRFWEKTDTGRAETRGDDPVASELDSPNPMDRNQGRSPAERGALVSLAQDEFVYIRNLGDGGEELFDERNDPLELTNLLRGHSGAGDIDPVLQAFRAHIKQAGVHP